MRAYAITLFAMAIAGLSVAACSPVEDKATRKDGAQSLCQSSGGFWDATYKSCTCNQGYMYDYTTKRCQYSTNGYNQYGNGYGTTPGMGANQCGVGMVMVNGQCQLISGVSDQQGCQGSGGTWSGVTCACPAGLTWQPAWKSCQSFAAGASGAQQLCQASGGMPGMSGQCQCPMGAAPQTHPTTGYQYCASGNGITGAQNSLAFAQMILGILQQIDRRP